MNSISIAKYDKPDWIVRKEKFNRYKVCNVKKFGFGNKNPRGGKVLFVYDYGNSLHFINLSYGTPVIGADRKATFKGSQSNKYILKVKNGCLNLWRAAIVADNQGQHTKKVIRNFSNRINSMDRELLSFGTKMTYGKTIPKTTAPSPVENLYEISSIIDCFECEDGTKKEILKTETRAFKIINIRLNKILREFFKRNNISVKLTPKPFDNIRAGIYKGTAGFALSENILNSTYSRHFRHGDIKYVIKKCFGHDSGKLVKLVCERIEKDKKFDILILGKLLKGLIPVDYFYQLIDTDLSEIQKISPMAISIKLNHCRELLKHYKAPRLFKLFKDEGIGMYNFRDSVTIYQNRKLEDGYHLPEKPKTWQELHNHLSPPRVAGGGLNYLEPVQLDYPLPIAEKIKDFDGYVLDDLKFEVPKRNHDLTKYSNLMNNCIRWYGSQIKDGGCSVMGVYRGEELLYNISIRGNNLDQFLGKGNSAPKSEDKEKVHKFLSQKGFAVPAEWD